METGARRPGMSVILRMLVVALAVLVLDGSRSVSVVAGPPMPGGVFSLSTPEQAVPADVLSNPFVAGISIRQRWSSYEKREGVYDRAFLDQEIGRVVAAGKVAFVRVVSGGNSIPDWVVRASGQLFHFTDKNGYHDTYGEQIVIPVPWDFGFLHAKKRAIAALGAHLDGNPTVAYVGTSCVNAYSDEWFLPTRAVDVSNWLAAGYTTLKMLDACMEIIDATAAAFPNKVMVMAVGINSAKLDPDQNYLARAVITYAASRYPGRFVVQKNSLSAIVADPTVAFPTKEWRVLLGQRPYVGGQMLWYVTDDTACRMNGKLTPCDPSTVLMDAVTTGVHYGMRYLEIYQKDIRNPLLAPVIRHAADALGIPATPTGLTGQVVSGTRINLSWNPSTDSVAVLGYHVYRNNTLAGITFTNAFADTGVKPDRSYTYRIAAFDAAENESPRSAARTFTTPP